MADKSKIEWTDSTWNIITGCTLVDEGCRHCYAAHLIANWPALGNHPSRKGLARNNAAGEAKFTGEVRFNEQWLDQPLRWKKPRRIFVCAHGDLFHENVPDEWIDRVFAVLALCPQHTFQVLTKRPDRARAYLRGDSAGAMIERWASAAGKICGDGGYSDVMQNDRTALPNVWLGTSISDQSSADLRIPDLLTCPAAVRFISAEPLLGPVDLRGPQFGATSCAYWCKTGCKASGDEECPKHCAPGIDWVICGGESGPKARPMHPDWARSLRDQCVAAEVAFFFKQNGEHVAIYDRDKDDPDWRRCSEVERRNRPGQWLNLAGGTGFHGERVVWAHRLGKARAGRLLDGATWDQMPGAAR